MTGGQMSYYIHIQQRRLRRSWYTKLNENDSQSDRSERLRRIVPRSGEEGRDGPRMSASCVCGPAFQCSYLLLAPTTSPIWPLSLVFPPSYLLLVMSAISFAKQAYSAFNREKPHVCRVLRRSGDHNLNIFYSPQSRSGWKYWPHQTMKTRHTMGSCLVWMKIQEFVPYEWFAESQN